MIKQFPLPTNKSFTRVRKQLVEALIFEGLIHYKIVENIDGVDSLFYLYGRKYTFICKGRITAFDRIRLDDSIYLKLNDQHIIEAPIQKLLEDLDIDLKSKQTILSELLQTVVFCEWNETNLLHTSSRRESCYEELESEIIEGHPYHPCYKSRTGFSIADHQRYGPEAKQSFPLKWTAIRREHMHISLLEKEEDFWRRELGQFLFERLVGELKLQGGTLQEYVFLPIHPWQFKSIQYLLQEGIQSREIILLGVEGDLYRATQSVRTLWNITHPEKAYIKLSMNMVNTSSLRTLDSHSICAAPIISAWLESMIESDFYLKYEASVVVLKEYAGITYEPEDDNMFNLSGQLGAIWRESINTYIEEDEKAVPFTALLMIERDGDPFIDPWLKKYGVETWIKRLFEVSVVPVWHLLIAHGIAIEAHAQNLILLHKNGWPSRIVLRDFHESVEFTKDYLAKENHCPDFEMIHKKFKGAPVNLFYWMSSVEDLRELIMDTLFVFHLSDLSYLLEKLYGYKEDEFWKNVESMITAHLNRFPELKNRHKQVKHASAHINVESLLTKKLFKKNESEAFRHSVRNIFAESRHTKEK